MYFIGSTDHRGTYFFHSTQHNGWITADLDMGKCALHNKLATIRLLNDWGNVESVLEARAGLGQDGEKWLVDGEELLPLLRKHAEELEVLMIYNQDGSEVPYGKVEQEAAKVMRKANKHFKKEA